MKKLLFVFSGLAIAMLSFNAEVATAQDCGCDSGGCRVALNSWAIRRAGSCDRDGMTQPVCPGNSCLGIRAAAALGDHYSPHPVYAYSRTGINAGFTHMWNQQQMSTYPWHGDYGSWRFGTPTALVVPPTAAFHTTYNWGVGQTTSRPIYHQFGMGGAGIAGGGEDMWSKTPLWPSSTDQFGIYPVRAPWGGN